MKRAIFVVVAGVILVAAGLSVSWYFCGFGWPPELFSQHAQNRTDPSLEFPTLLPEAQADKEKENFVETLKNDARWYSFHGEVMGAVWVVSNFLIVVFTAATSLLVALKFSEKSEKWRIGMAALPAFAGLLAVLLNQFHVADKYQLREFGRIESMSIRDEVRLVSAATKSEMREKLAKFRRARVDLEMRQASLYFSYLNATGQNGITKPGADDIITFAPK